MPFFTAYDRLIDSVIDLPGAMPEPQAQGDWTVTLHSLPATNSPKPGLEWRGGELHWPINPDELHLCRDRHLAVRVSATADSAAIAPHIIANGLPALAWIAGDIVLHACAVVMPGADAAIAIMAPSRGGKSTLLAQLMDAGASLVADDSIVLRIEAGQWVCSGLPMGWFERDDSGQGRRYVPAPAGRSLRRARLGVLVDLRLVDEPVASPVERMDGIAAMTALLRHRHRPQVPQALGSTAAVMRSLAQIAARIPVHTLKRRRGEIMLTTEQRQTISSLPDA